MKDLNKILLIIVIILSLVLIYLVFTGNNNLKSAQKEIEKASSEINVVKDSLTNAQKNISDVLKKIEFAENELKLIKAQRDLLQAEEAKKFANDWEELQQYKKEIQAIKDKQKDLMKMSEIYDPTK